MATETKALTNNGIERSVLQGIMQYGPDMLIDLEEFLSTNDFNWKANKDIFSAAHYLTHQKNYKSFDIASIIAVLANEKFSEGKYFTYLESLFESGPSKENTKALGLCMYKLSLARQAVTKLEETIQIMLKVTGEEPINEIISSLEDPILGFSSSLSTQDMHEATDIGEGIEEYLQTLADDPKDVIGLSSGFPRWDSCIGGGLRRGSVHVVAARPKVGKSFWALNVGRNIAEKKIPVLYLDTELTRTEDQLPRITSLISGVDIECIETGKFAAMPDMKSKVDEVTQKIKNLPMTHAWVGGFSPDAIIAEARRWLIKRVGFNEEGRANECLIVYDYLKIMNHEDIKSNLGEYQIMGFVMTKLHDFVTRWGIPLIAMAQLNQDEVLATSDRIRWLCTSLTYIKGKSSEELNVDPPTNGAKKIIIDVTRKGPGLPQGEYINLKSNLQIADFTEGPKSKEAMAQAFNDQLMNEKKTE